MQLSQITRFDATCDDNNLIAAAGLIPVMTLAARAGLQSSANTYLTVPGGAGCDSGAKIATIVAGMVAGADSIDDLDLLREGAVHKVLPGVKAPSTVGTFLRTFTFGHVKQLEKVAGQVLTNIAGRANLIPDRSADRDAVAWLDIDDTIRATYGYGKEGAGYGYNKVKGLNALIAVVSTSESAPIIVGSRLRKGTTNSARGGGKFLSDAVATARRAGPVGPIVVRADSAFYNAKVVGAAQAAGVRFSITARMNPSIRKAIASIGEDKWVPIKYPQAIWDEDDQAWISDAEVAETRYTAFTSKGKGKKVTARLIVRRVKRVNPDSYPQGQEELFTAYRFHAVFTNNTEPMLKAESHHRHHAIVEQVIAELKGTALAHLPSGKFNANAAWLTCATIAYNLTRAAGALAGGKFARARTTTIQAKIIRVPARVSYSARVHTLHLPARHRHEEQLMCLFPAKPAKPAKAPPKAA